MIVLRKHQSTGKRIVGQINGITGLKKEIAAVAMIDPNTTETIVDRTTAGAGKTTVNTMITEVKNVGKQIEAVMMNTENRLAGMKTTNRTIDEMINRTIRIRDDGRMTCIWIRMLGLQVNEKAALFAAKNVSMYFLMQTKNSTKRNYWTPGDCNVKPLVSRVLHTSGENRLSGQMSK